MNKSLFMAISALAAMSSAAWAGSITGTTAVFTVNTSSLSGTNGSIDFDLTQANSQAATAQIFDFSGATYIGGSQQDDGTASGGPVSAPITLGSTLSPGSDDFEAVSFGTTLSFEVQFSGPAITSPLGTGNSPDTFFFSVYSDPGGLNSVLDNSLGYVGEVTVNEDTGQLFGTSSTAATTISSTPEPASVWLVGGAFLALGFLGLRRRIA